MLSIVLTIIAFNILIVIFKLFAKFNVDNLQALIVNYFIASFCGLYFSDIEFNLSYILSAPWLYHAAAIGILFITTFNLYAKGTQKVGIAVTTVANKLSLFIPVAIALIIYKNEQITVFKITGFVLAAIGIYLSSTTNKKLSFDKKYLWLIIIVFVGQGIADTIFNHAQQTVVDENDKGLFFMCLLLIAGASGIVILVGKSVKQKPQLKFKNLIGGIALGLPNFASLIFFFNALESSGLGASQVFPVVSMGVVVLSAIVGLVLFKEKLSRANWLGLGFAILSIFIITFL